MARRCSKGASKKCQNQRSFYICGVGVDLRDIRPLGFLGKGKNCKWGMGLISITMKITLTTSRMMVIRMTILIIMMRPPALSVRAEKWLFYFLFCLAEKMAPAQQHGSFFFVFVGGCVEYFHPRHNSQPRFLFLWSSNLWM